MRSIRKISIGKDYPNGSLHYQVGGKQRLKGKMYEITEILEDRESQPGKLVYNVYVRNLPESSDEPVARVKWKTVSDMPVVIEDDIHFV